MGKRHKKVKIKKNVAKIFNSLIGIHYTSHRQSTFHHYEKLTKSSSSIVRFFSVWYRNFQH